MKQKKTQAQKLYEKRVRDAMPKTRVLPGCIKAFLVGGFICCIGQGIGDFGRAVLGLSKDADAAFCAIVLVFLGMLLTGLGVYDKIGHFAGSGSIVPITGFANSIVAPAMEYKREGFVLGVGANMFKLAGPVLVYGYGSSVIVGLIYYLYLALT